MLGRNIRLTSFSYLISIMFLLNFSKPCAAVYIVPVFPFSFSSVSEFLPVPGSSHFLPSQRCCLLHRKTASTTCQNLCDQGAACCEIAGKSLRLLPASHSSHPHSANNFHYLLQVVQRLSRFMEGGLLVPRTKLLLHLTLTFWLIRRLCYIAVSRYQVYALMQF